MLDMIDEEEFNEAKKVLVIQYIFGKNKVRCVLLNRFCYELLSMTSAKSCL